MTDTTLLTLSGMGVTPYSARGLSQTLAPIGGIAPPRRNINGELIDVSAPQFRKYKSTISGNDQQPPAIDKIWVGMTLTVGCIQELAYTTMGGSPGRGVVSSRTEGEFTFYLPSLVMKVIAFNLQTDEYGATVTWSMDLEEV